MDDAMRSRLRSLLEGALRGLDTPESARATLIDLRHELQELHREIYDAAFEEDERVVEQELLEDARWLDAAPMISPREEDL